MPHENAALAQLREVWNELCEGPFPQLAERRGDLVGRNIPGNKFQPIFEAGVAYFK